jgi:hypothetical protein
MPIPEYLYKQIEAIRKNALHALQYSDSKRPTPLRASYPKPFHGAADLIFQYLNIGWIYCHALVQYPWPTSMLHIQIPPLYIENVIETFKIHSIMVQVELESHSRNPQYRKDFTILIII